MSPLLIKISKISLRFGRRLAVVAGQIILDAIGIHLHSFKVAGGITFSLGVASWARVPR
jgi:small neutral amino acid transporter SnatA (MarC family)